MELSRIPHKCLVEIEKEPCVKCKYEIAFNKVSYVRDAMTSKRCKAMARVKEICEGRYLSKIQKYGYGQEGSIVNNFFVYAHEIIVFSSPL
jgi:hypothetical protein